MAPYDVLLTPALAQRPLPVGTLDLDGDQVMGEFARTGLFTPFTAVWNVTGQPAVSLPLYHGDDGLPTGVQLVGPAGRRGACSCPSRRSSKPRAPGRTAAPRSSSSAGDLEAARAIRCPGEPRAGLPSLATEVLRAPLDVAQGRGAGDRQPLVPLR